MYKKRIFNIKKIERILVVAYRHGIGTFILLTPFLKTLKKNISNCEITLLIDSDVVAELAYNCKYIDKIINKKGLSVANLLTGIKYFKKEIAPHKYDLTVSTIYERTSRNTFWTYFSRAPYRISFNKNVSAFFDTYTFDWNPNIHEVENYLQVLKSIGCEEIYDDLNLEVNPESEGCIDRFLNMNNISDKHVLLGVHPGSKKGWQQKRWPLEHFIEVAQRFFSSFRAKVIFFAGPDEKEIFPESFNGNPNFILFADQGIRQTQALIKRCSLFLSNDSGLMHIAALHGIPTVTIFGPTNPIKNSPWKVPCETITAKVNCSPCYDYAQIKCQRNECMKSILPEEVFQILKDFYNKVKKGER